MFSSIFDNDTSESKSRSNAPPNIDYLPSIPTTLEYVVNHVFFAGFHPQHNDYTEGKANALVCAVRAAACAYNEHLNNDHKPYWLRVTKMLDNLQAIVKPSQLRKPDGGVKYRELCWVIRRKNIIVQLGGMNAGDVLAFPVRNCFPSCGVIFRKQDRFASYELLTTSRDPSGREKVAGSCPEPAIKISNKLFDNGDFRSGLARFFSDTSREQPHGRVCGIKLKCIAQRVGSIRVVRRIRHRKQDSSDSWCRSHLWLLIRVTIQSSVAHSPLGRGGYKTFMLFFMYSLANHAVKSGLSSILLYSMSAKILRRVRKLGDTVPQWLRHAALETCAILSQTIDTRWQEVRAIGCSSPTWVPLRLGHTKDTRHSLLDIHEFISSSVANCSSSPRTAFLSNGRLHHSLDEFLSDPDRFLSGPDEESHHDDIHVMLYDVERAVREDIDDWVSSVTNIEDACKHLRQLIHRYLSSALQAYRHRRIPRRHTRSESSDPISGSDDISIMLLTIIELWVALDKLAIKEIPFLADYSPEVPLNFLSALLLRDPVNIHRFSRVYQYLSARHNQAQSGWLVFSNHFTEHSFPCRYYDCSSSLQQFKAHIDDILPAEPLYAKIVVFELQSPAFFEIWRSVTCWISRVEVEDKDEDDTRCFGICGTTHVEVDKKDDIQVCHIPALQPHISAGRIRSLPLYSSPSAPQRWERLYYVRKARVLDRFEHAYELPDGPYTHSGLQQYLNDTAQNSNDVLAAQGGCDPHLSLQEFIAFAHLRSGGSLQWFNVLRELRSRTLEFRHPEVYMLFAQASTQVGPINSAGELLWHQELEDFSLCHGLLDELESLFLDVGVGSLDGPAMATISLLACVLVSKPPEGISERAIRLLQNVRRTTFDCVRELQYNARKSPTDEECVMLLRNMAAVCRSTFDVGSTMSHKLFRSPHDIEAALSCAMLIRMTAYLGSKDVSTYFQVLMDRSRRLSLILEASLKDAIEADVSDAGVDRAIQLVWPGYRPSPRRWEPLQSPHSHWLVCETAPTSNTCSQTVHVSLLDGSLLVDGRMGDKLPSNVTSNAMYHELFGEHNLMVVTSDLSEMDFVTMSVIHGYFVHFAIRSEVHASSNNESIVIRAQSKDTDDIFELVPRDFVRKDLPTSLVEGHVHWLNRAKSLIEIRPTEKPWQHSWDNWTIDFRAGQSRIWKGNEFLVDKRSPTWTMVSGRFQCLDDPENLLITLSPVEATQSPSLRVFIALPRYGLSFYVNEADNFESLDFEDMVYDEDQCIGTLSGLVNRLVLRPKADIEAVLIPKRIVIPYSRSLNRCDHRISVAIPPSGPVSYYTYEVDSELGCLKGIVSLESKEYLARLHFLTGNGCRPDQLTGRTGVEEAISLMVSAGTRQGTHEWRHAQSPQLRFVLAKIGSRADDKSETSVNPGGQVIGTEPRLPTDDALRRERCLFPSEVTADAKLPREDLLGQLLHKRSAPDLRPRNRLPPSHYNSGRHGSSSNINSLRQLFSSLGTNDTSASPFQSHYISRLHSSAHTFQTTPPTGVTLRANTAKPNIELLRQHYVQCRTNYMESLDMLRIALGPETEFERIFHWSGQWPRVTPFVLFRCLASTSPIKPSESWKTCLVSLALLALDVQRARRLLQLALSNLEEEFYKELENDVCDGWDPAQYPDWLLIQLQGNFLIRHVQANIANEMMYPRSGKNTTVQVNMGEGKSSVIIPICAAALADGNRLVRVVAPKALIPQTLQLLTDRLCGLVNKPVYHLTFSRDQMGRDTRRLLAFVRNHRDECGIIVTQPEHVLSVKLGCVEVQLLANEIQMKSSAVVQKRGFRLDLHVVSLPAKSPTRNTSFFTMVRRVKRWRRRFEALPVLAREFVNLLKFFEIHARDILDESDDVLSPQFQLLYAIGHQLPFEDSPNRWVVVQHVLGLVKRHACLLSTPDSHTIRCQGSSSGSFPHIHILQAGGGQQLTSLIAQDVALDHHLSRLSFHSEPGPREAIREFILRKDIHPDTVNMVEKHARKSTHLGTLLLLRGLLAHGILLFALTQRRWRVDYGLDPTSQPRTMLAIPYRAKDMPAESAEFGHPDIAILLTCLSYYYGGLSEEQLRISFELLLQQDDPSSEYAFWLEDYGIELVPKPLQQLSGVNIRSLEQWHKHIVPLFSRNKRAIDMYLSKIVFPKYAKEFPLRISGSSWDIAEQKNHLVTGFSGTNDGQYLLPTSITQDDPDHLQQAGTNAKVLAYLLQPENSSYTVTADDNGNGERWNTCKLLSVVVAQKEAQIRVLLDVGAQILDLSNFQVAKAWLDCTSATEIAGAIYFSQDDRLLILARNGTTQPLSSSPLARKLHQCVAYLDHTHTRGTDIRFPLGFRAAVTLGHKVTKDRLVQGCMRMRKLGQGHSIAFFAPREIDQRIRGLVSKENPITRVTTADIVHWTIQETWREIEHQAPYWAQHGMNHQSRYEAWLRFVRNKATPEQMANAWVQQELKSLADMYMPCRPVGATSSSKLPVQLRERCAIFGISSLHDARMDEEQEREVSREIEREREVERPPEASPAEHSLHPDVIAFVRTGAIPSPILSRAFRRVFVAGMNGTFGALRHWSPNILVTTDFCKTVKDNTPVEGRINDYLRPVQWVLSRERCGKDALVILSPFEADNLMPEIRKSEHVHLHLYIPRMTKRMKPADDLTLYSVPALPSDWTPPWALIDQLNVFAGQLYLADYATYVRLCRFLGVPTEGRQEGTVTRLRCKRFNNPGSSDKENRLEGTKLPVVAHFLAVRRGVGLSETHTGRILEGLPLTEKDFQGSESRNAE